jgi:DNA-binding LacI/PurR family transcriptional regulator
VVKRTPLIGCLASTNANPFFPQIIKSIKDIAFQNNIGVFVCNSEGWGGKVFYYIQMLPMGYQKALTENGIAFDERYGALGSSFSEVESYTLTKVLLARYPEISAIFAYSKNRPSWSFLIPPAGSSFSSYIHLTFNGRTTQPYVITQA